MLSRIALVFVLGSSLFVPGPVGAEDWPGWRGADGNGVSAQPGFPLKWSQEKKKNLLWSVELPQWGNSSPCIVGDRIFLTAQKEGDALYVLCISRSEGRVTWQQQVGRGKTKHHRLHNMASPTCVATADRVCALFGTGDLVCLDSSGGKVLWRKDLVKDHGEYRILWGMGSSPLLHSGRLYIACMNGGPSYLLCVDIQTGKYLWKKDRKLPCTGEAADAYSSPVLFDWKGEQAVVVSGADHVNAYDPASGRQLWISSGLEIPHAAGRSIASPTASGGMVFATSSGYGGLGRVIGLKLDKEAVGDITKSRRSWTYKQHSPDCPTPVCYRGRLYLVRDNGVGSCLDAVTGELKWRERIFRGNVKASPVAADGKVYFTAMSGETIVLAAGDEFKIAGKGKVAGQVIATPALADGTIYIRSKDRLWAIRKAAK